MYLKLFTLAVISLGIVGNTAAAGCEPNPCLNGGTCSPVDGTKINYSCSCAVGYLGNQCELKEKKLDLTFVLGQSGNASAEDWKKMVGFVDAIASSLPINPNEVKLAVITYSTKSSVAWNLNAHANLAALKQALAKLTPLGAASDIQGALRMLHQDVYTKAGGDRAGVRNVVMFLKDGVGSKGKKKVLDEAQACHSAGIEIYVVALGKKALLNIDQVNAIASDPDSRHVIKLGSVDHLSYLAGLIVAEIGNMV